MFLLTFCCICTYFLYIVLFFSLKVLLNCYIQQRFDNSCNLLNHQFLSDFSNQKQDLIDEVNRSLVFYLDSYNFVYRFKFQKMFITNSKVTILIIFVSIMQMLIMSHSFYRFENAR